jgi:hypothetical protein
MSKGRTFAKVINFTNPIPFLDPSTFINARPKKIAKRNIIRTTSFCKTGKIDAAILKTALATAASDEIQEMRKITIVRNPK